MFLRLCHPGTFTFKRTTTLKAKASIFQQRVKESPVSKLMSGKRLPELMTPLTKLLEAGQEVRVNHHLTVERLGRRQQPLQRQGKQTAAQRVRSRNTKAHPYTTNVAEDLNGQVGKATRERIPSPPRTHGSSSLTCRRYLC